MIAAFKKVRQAKRPSRRPRRVATITVSALAALALAASLTLWATRLDASTTAASADERVPVLTVNTQLAEPQSSYSIQRSFVGRVEAARASDLGFELGGLVAEIRADEGEAVAADQIIARLDTGRLRARRQEVVALRDQADARLAELVKGPREEDIAEARAEVDQYGARLDLARLTMDRTEKLLARRAVSEQEWDEDRLNVTALDAQLRAAEQRLNELRTGTRAEQIDAQRAAVRHLESQIDSIDVDLEKSNLRAPFDGVVSKRFIDEGVVRDAGGPVVRVLEEGRHEIRVGVAAELAGRFSAGDEAHFKVRGESVAARVKSILPEREGRTRTVTVLFTVVEPNAAIRSGDLAEITVDEHVHESGFWLPATALTESYQGLWASFVAEPSNEGRGDVRRIARRQVEVLHTTGEIVFVRGTLAAGEQVVTAGVHRLVPDQIVRIAVEIE